MNEVVCSKCSATFSSIEERSDHYPVCTGRLAKQEARTAALDTWGRWQYFVDDDLSDDALNRLGAQGWELVSVITRTFTKQASFDRVYSYRFFFKRRHEAG